MSVFDTFLASRTEERRYLVEIYAYNKSTPAAQTLYYSSSGFVTKPTDTPANQVYEGRISVALSIKQTLFSNGTIGGKSVPGFGSLVLNNSDGALDFLRNFAFDGRRVVVRMGGQFFNYGDYGIIFDGTAETAELGLDTVSLRLRDLQYKFDVPLHSLFYSGAGGWNGTAEVQGQVIPHAYGQVRNIQPRIVDAANLRYQVHYRAVQSINNVRDKGVALTFSANYANTAALDAAVIPAGNYATCLAAGVLKLGSAPAGTITCDVQGDNTGSYVSSVGDIIQRIVTTAAGFSAGDLDAASFTALNTANSAVVGYYAKEAVNVVDVLDSLANSIGAWFGFNRSGKMIVGRLTAPSGSPVATFSKNDVLGVERIPTALPIWRTRFGYRKMWGTLDISDLATSYLPGGANANSGVDFTEEWRFVTPAEDPAVKTAHLLAGEETFYSLLDAKADADTEAARLLALYKVQRDVYRVALKTQPFSLKLGDLVQVNLNRYGLDSGRLFTIIGFEEDTASSTVTLELWG